MKKLIAIVLCLMVLGCSSFTAMALEEETTTTTTTESTTTSVPVEDEIPVEDETPVEDEVVVEDEEIVEDDTTEDETVVEDTTTDAPVEEETTEDIPEDETTEAPAEDEVEEDVAVDTPAEDTTEEETPVEDTTVEDVPNEDNTVEETPVETPTEDEVVEEDESFFEDVTNTVTGIVADWIADNMDWLSIVATLLGYGVVLLKKFKSTDKKLGIFNNNTVTVASDMKTFMSDALENVKNMSSNVDKYDERISQLLTTVDKLIEAYTSSEEDKKRLEAELARVETRLESATKSNIEFANELAELLSLANIPNFKKEEIGKRHLEAVNALIKAEADAEAIADGLVEEVIEDVREEA